MIRQPQPLPSTFAQNNQLQLLKQPINGHLAKIEPHEKRAYENTV